MEASEVVPAAKVVEIEEVIAPSVEADPLTIVITGTSSGLGYTFLEHYARTSPPGTTIYSIDVKPVEVKTATQARTMHFEANVSDANSLSDFRKEVGNKPVDLLIHCAGVRGLVDYMAQASPDNVAAAENIVVMNAPTMMKTLETNTVGTFLMIQITHRNLKLSHERRGKPPKVIVMSSRMGSIQHNTSGAAYAYRASKAALNAIVKSYSVDFPEITFALVHPGRVETQLVGSREAGAIEANESVEDMLKLMERIGVDPSLRSGCFVDRWGVMIPW
ncbi:NAD(P)-binding protein [Saccharata proteae CBS 121410]|uniref:NAD(P)-binding protein n=1 Tax=Saccharata proteae CBS 121410 TaxID=1314787 RepID=A0A9P4LT25_9PEZI|nr:NAD(P)-binding protein [Saccharata proteae CBS 121410]